MYEVSVIIPTYKPKYYIYECLNSLQEQTLEKEFFEILIILNGVKNPYYTQIKDFISKSKLNIRLLYTEREGVSNARNFGLDCSNSKYIVFLDDDDILSKNYLYNMLQIADKKNICISNLLCFNEDIKNTYVDYIGKAFLPEITSTNLFKMRKFTSAIGGKLIPMDIIENIRFNTKFKNGEDSLFMTEITKNIKCYNTSNIDTIYYRRIRKNSASHNRSIYFSLKNSSRLIIEYFKFIFKSNYNTLYIFTRILAQYKNIFNKVLELWKNKENLNVKKIN